ncbi:Non-reducing polyketide synthase andM [Cladobotryum mycophilum]|uniref:Non-reducing polyketide synthase andM n=1 Tax=Cladobotryum mycophilum TaxID=491253 RepID=A0ABR0ST96_9HYPO
MPSDQVQEMVKVALFSPQVTNWTPEGLSRLQSRLEDDDMSFLRKTLMLLPSLWGYVQDEFAQSDFRGESMLNELATFATGDGLLDPARLGNTHLAPLTIISQAAQGFCIGFLTAAAFACSSNWEEFAKYVPNAIRLAACIGLVIDAEDVAQAPRDRATALSLRWKTMADRALLETCLDSFTGAYISCVTDDRALTVTVPNRHYAAFNHQLGRDNISTTAINLNGSYHHEKQTKAAETLKEICFNHPDLQLPSADKLQLLPLRSTIDADIVSAGLLHNIAIDSILCKRAHWFQTVKMTVADLPRESVKFVTLSADSCIPRSLLRNKVDSGSSTISEENPKGSVYHSQIEEIAVVGMACRFANVDCLQEFWELLSSGSTSVSKLPANRFDSSSIHREPSLPDFWGNFLRKPGAFDHRFFGMSGREAKSLDPQQRLALQVAYEALESSGYCSLILAERETDVGCYIGVVGADYEDNVASDAANAFSATGTLRAFVSGRISHYFGWSGPSIVLDTACSSSSVAVHTACRALLNGECAMAMAGGVNIVTSPNMHQNLAAGSFLNPNGASRAFDAAGGGYCRGEGAGILVLKKLSRAISDNDMIIGVIAGTAVNQGSGCNGITVPSSQAQSLLYRKALSIGQIRPEDVTYVEAHGTGTPIGDPIEYESVRASLTSPARNEILFLGSLKDNIGHTEAASGAAGIIKTLLMMHHGIIPKQANFTTLSPRINSSLLDRIEVPKVTQPWIVERQVALVNNYGVAGSNAAIVLREHASGSRTSQSPLSKTLALYPILMSAKSVKSLHSYTHALEKYLTSTSKLDFAHFAYNVNRRQNPSFEHRFALTSLDAEHLIFELKEKQVNSSNSLPQKGKLPVVLCFGGQTGRRVFLPRELYESCDILRKHLDDCNSACQLLGLPSIIPSIFDGGDTEDVVSLHCMLLSLQISCARSWIDCGLEIDTLIGYSFGQLVALCIADSISLRDAFRLVSGRARLIRDSWGSEQGVMVLIECSRIEMEEVVEAVNSSGAFQIDVACYNGPRSFVLAGDVSSVERLEKECRGLKTKCLNNTYAYHSYMADGILKDFRAIADSIIIQLPRIHIETCSSDAIWSEFNAEQLVQHTRKPVYFGEAVDRVSARLPSALWLEAGSASPIIAMTRRLLREHDRQDVFLAMDLGSTDAISKLSDAACQIWKSGGAAVYWPFHRSSSYRFQRLNIPPYQFEDTHHWIENKPRSTSMTVESPTQPTFKLNLVKLVKKDLTKGNYVFLVDRTHLIFDAIVRGHVVTGQCLCPVTMYTELATLCAILLSDSVAEPDKLPYVEGLVMSHPLGLAGDHALYLRLVHTPQDSWEFTAFTQLYKNGSLEDVETKHAGGHLSLVSKSDAVSLSRWKLLNRVARISHADRVQSLPLAYGISGPMVYRLFADIVEYAPFYRQSVDAGLTDPVTLDSFIQVAGIYVNCLLNRRNGEVFMCNAVEEIAISLTFMRSRAGSQSWTVYTRYEKTSKVSLMNDIFVYDTSSKELVVAIMGASFRSIPCKYLAKSLSTLDTAVVRLASSAANSIAYSDDEDTKDSVYASPMLQRDQAPAVLNLTDSLLYLVRDMFSEIMEIPIEEIEPASILNDLGVDSLLATEVLTEIQKRFKTSISQEQFLNCVNILSLCQLIQPENKVVSSQSVKEPKSTKSTLEDACINDLVVRPQNDRQETEEMKNFAFISKDCFLEVRPSFDHFAEVTRFANFCSDAYKLQTKLVA